MRIPAFSAVLILLLLPGHNGSLFSKIYGLTTTVTSKVASKLPLPAKVKSLLKVNQNKKSKPAGSYLEIKGKNVTEVIILPTKSSPKKEAKSFWATFLPKGFPVPISKYNLFGIPLSSVGGNLVNKKTDVEKEARKMNKTDENYYKFDFGLKKIGLEVNYAFPKVALGPFQVKPAIGGGCMIKTPLAMSYHKIEDGDNFVMGCSQFKCRIHLGRVVKFPVWLPDCFRRPGLEIGERCCIRPDNLSKGGFVSCAETNIVTWLFGLDGRKRKILGLIPNYFG